MKNLNFVLVFLLLSLSARSQSLKFSSSADVLFYLGDNNYNNENTELRFSQNGAFLEVGNYRFSNPIVKIISTNTAIIKYYSISNPNLVTSLIVNSSDNSVIDNSNGRKYFQHSRFSAFEQLEKIRREGQAEAEKIAFQEQIRKKEEEKKRAEELLLLEIKNYKPENYKNFKQSPLGNQIKYTNKQGYKIGRNVFKINNRFVEIGSPYPINTTFTDADKILKKLGNGWRLPSNDETKIMYEMSILDVGYPGFKSYWTSTIDPKTKKHMCVSKIDEHRWGLKYVPVPDPAVQYGIVVKKGISKRSEVVTQFSTSLIPVRDIKLDSQKEYFNLFIIGNPFKFESTKILKDIMSKTTYSTGDNRSFTFSPENLNKVRDVKSRMENPAQFFQQKLRDILTETTNNVEESSVIEISEYYHPFSINFYDSQNIQNVLGEGWRLPTLKEFTYIFIASNHFNSYLDFEKYKSKDSYYENIYHLLTFRSGEYKHFWGEELNSKEALLVDRYTFTESATKQEIIKNGTFDKNFTSDVRNGVFFVRNSSK